MTPHFKLRYTLYRGPFRRHLIEGPVTGLTLAMCAIQMISVRTFVHSLLARKDDDCNLHVPRQREGCLPVPPPVLCGHWLSSGFVFYPISHPPQYPPSFSLLGEITGHRPISTSLSVTASARSRRHGTHIQLPLVGARLD